MDVERIVPRPLARAVIVGIVAAAGVGTAAAQGGTYERQKVDPAAATRSRGVYAQHCINCHGSAAKGTDRGPDLIRSPIVLRDRLGSGIGPAVRKSATHQAALTDAQVESDLTWTNSRGETHTQPTLRALVHFANHGTYHRGQVASLLRQMGHTPPSTDLVYWKRGG